VASGKETEAVLGHLDFSPEGAVLIHTGSLAPSQRMPLIAPSPTSAVCLRAGRGPLVRVAASTSERSPEFVIGRVNGKSFVIQ
jgi:hypothetical protein